MRNCGLMVAILLFGGVTSSFGLLRSELSEAARALLPDGSDGLIVRVKTGQIYKGVVESESETEIKLRVSKGGITASRTIQKADITAQKMTDVSSFFSAALLKLELDEKKGLSAKEYRDGIALFLEFIEKCPESKHLDAIRDRCRGFMVELKLQSKGLEKVEGEWLYPVAAAVRKFEVYGRQIEELGKRDDAKTNERVIKAVEMLTTDRRETARRLPKLTKDRVETLVGEQKFDEAVSEITAFLHFWIDQVVVVEGDERKDEGVLKEMDASYILQMEQFIMERYKAAGEGNAACPANVEVPGDMVFVPGGYFLMGKDGDDSSAIDFPVHIVYVSPFLIDKYEVSNAQYREFMEFLSKTRESWMEHPDAPPLKKHDPEGWKKKSLSADDQPVVGVDWFDAYAYAKWAGKRLPTEAEWEKSARGMDSRPYPWGESLKGVIINWSEGRRLLAKEMDRQNPPDLPDPIGAGFSCVRKKDLPPPPATSLREETWPVDKGLAPQAVKAVDAEMFIWEKGYVSPYGAHHMAGNAAEWVHDVYSKRYYGESPIIDPQGPESGKVHVHRGGSFLADNQEDLTTFERSGMSPREMRSSRRSRMSVRERKKKIPYIGFRCAKTIPGLKAKRAEVDEEISFEALMRSIELD